MSFATDQMDRMGLRRCPGCPGTAAVIPSDGPTGAEVWLIGEKPGKEENNKGRCFVGQTGKEIDQHYLPLAGLTRPAVRLTNLSRCYHELNSDSEQARQVQVACAAYHLRYEIQNYKPKLIIPMGGVACKTLIEGFNMELQHGIPIEGMAIFGHPCSIYPIQHPAQGLHQTDLILDLRTDFINLGKYLSGQLHMPVDEHAGKEHYELIDTVSRFNVVVKDTEPDWVTGLDTEYDDDGIFCLSFSNLFGTGYVVRRSDILVVQAFNKWLTNRMTGIIAFHNGLADLPKLEQIDCHIPMRRYDDTMIRAYHLQYLDQGLKTLASRLCGMKMKEYLDVVMPWAVDVMSEYIIQLSMDNWPKPESQVILDPKGNWKEYKPQGLNTKLKRLLTDLGKAKEDRHKVFDRWDKWSEEERLPAIAKYGDMPQPSVKYVPIDELVDYAGRDPDATLRVRHKLISLKRQFRGKPA